MKVFLKYLSRLNFLILASLIDVSYRMFTIKVEDMKQSYIANVNIKCSNNFGNFLKC